MTVRPVEQSDPTNELERGSEEERFVSGRNRRIRPSVLILARSYPNNVLPQLGVWTQRLVQSAALEADVKVISPVPFTPPLPPVPKLKYYARFRNIKPG